MLANWYISYIDDRHYHTHGSAKNLKIFEVVIRCKFSEVKNITEVTGTHGIYPKRHTMLYLIII